MYEKIAHLYPPGYNLSIPLYVLCIYELLYLQNYLRYQVQIFNIS